MQSRKPVAWVFFLHGVLDANRLIVRRDPAKSVLFSRIGALLKAKVTRSKCEPFLFRMQRMTTSPAPASPHEDRRPVGQLGGLLVRRGLGRVSSQKLLGTLRELEIEHGTERYRLRVTSTGKLILTK